MTLAERKYEHVQVEKGAYVSIHLTGRLDNSYEGYEEIQDVVIEAMEKERNVVIDMTEVTYIGFLAMRSLSKAACTLDNGEIHLVIDHKKVYRQFHLFGHKYFFSIHRTKEGALTNLGIEE